MQMACSNWFRSRADRTDLPKELDFSDAAEAIAFGEESGEIVYRVA